MERIGEEGNVPSAASSSASSSSSSTSEAPDSSYLLIVRGVSIAPTAIRGAHQAEIKLAFAH